MLSPRILGLLLALVTLLVYLPTTTSQFINYDDPDYVTHNDVVQKGLTWEGVKWAFDGAHASNWHPLTWLSHMLDCDLFRLNPAGPHLVNSLFHALNAALLFAWLFRLTGKTWPSALVAALFAWHPLHVESVAWIAERKDVLSTFFTLLTLWSYVGYARKKTRFDYGCALGFFVLALLAKPMPVTLPVVMLLLDFWPLKRMENGCELRKVMLPLVWEKIPFFLLSAGVCIVTILAQHHAESSLAEIPIDHRVGNALLAYAGYLWKMVWPMQLGLLYPLKSPFPWSAVAEAAIILTGLSLVVWRERKTSPWLLVGWLWFLVTLLPTIGLVQVGGQAMADRYTYFPLVGIFLALAVSLQTLVDRFGFLKNWVVVAAVLVLGACVVLTEEQLSYWHDSESIFRHTLTLDDSYVARVGLGVALNDKNQLSAALHEYIMAALLAPKMPLIYDDIGHLIDAEGKTAMAAEYYQLAVKYGPETPGYHDDFGLVLVRLKHFPEAQREFSAAAKADPTAAVPHFLIGRLLLQEGRDVEAVSELRRSLQLDPNDAENLYFTASVLAADEDPKVRNGADACIFAEKAVQLTHEQQPAALDVLAMGYAETGRFDAAVQIQQQAIKLAEAAGQPDDLATLQKRLQCYQGRHPWRELFH